MLLHLHNCTSVCDMLFFKADTADPSFSVPSDVINSFHYLTYIHVHMRAVHTYTAATVETTES